MNNQQEDLMSELKVVGGNKQMVMAILDSTGDTKVMWNPRDKDEVDAAKTTFEKLLAKGFRAFRVNAKGEPGERIDKFDKKAEKIIMVPQLAGG